MLQKSSAGQECPQEGIAAESFGPKIYRSRKKYLTNTIQVHNYLSASKDNKSRIIYKLTMRSIVQGMCPVRRGWTDHTNQISWPINTLYPKNAGSDNAWKAQLYHSSSFQHKVACSTYGAWHMKDQHSQVQLPLALALQTWNWGWVGSMVMTQLFWGCFTSWLFELLAALVAISCFFLLVFVNANR